MSATRLYLSFENKQSVYEEIPAFTRHAVGKQPIFGSIVENLSILTPFFFLFLIKNETPARLFYIKQRATKDLENSLPKKHNFAERLNHMVQV